MSKQKYPLINGRYWSWANVEIRVAGKIVGGITEINYSDKLEPAYVMGAGAQPIGKTVGIASYEGDFGILLAQFYELLEIVNADGDGYGTVDFDIIVSYSDLGINEVTPAVQDVLVGCSLTSSAASASSTSADGLTKKLTVKPIRILLNGNNIGPESPGADI